MQQIHNILIFILPIRQNNVKYAFNKLWFSAINIVGYMIELNKQIRIGKLVAMNINTVVKTV